MSAERIKRPTPERTGPVRNWATLFGPPGAGGPAQGAPPFAGMPGMPFPFPGAGGPPPFPGAAPPGGGVAQGVATGYQVIDQYLRQGQSAARAMWGGGTGPGPGRGAGDPQQLMEGFTRQATQLAGMWLDMLNLVVPGTFGGYGAPPAGTAGPFWMGGEPPAATGWPGSPRAEPPRPPGAPPPHAPPPPWASAPAPVAAETRGGEPTTIVVEVDATQRTKVTFDLRPRSLGRRLRVHDLRAPEADKARITHVTIAADAADEQITIAVHVPAGHPAGIYSGIILDEDTSLPRGTLTVEVG